MPLEHQSALCSKALTGDEHPNPNGDEIAYRRVVIENVDASDSTRVLIGRRGSASTEFGRVPAAV